jgi:hypothetical protein
MISTLEVMSSGSAVCSVDFNVFGISVVSFYDEPEGEEERGEAGRGRLNG